MGALPGYSLAACEYDAAPERAWLHANDLQRGLGSRRADVGGLQQVLWLGRVAGAKRVREGGRRPGGERLREDRLEGVGGGARIDPSRARAPDGTTLRSSRIIVATAGLAVGIACAAIASCGGTTIQTGATTDSSADRKRDAGVSVDAPRDTPGAGDSRYPAESGDGCVESLAALCATAGAGCEPLSNVIEDGTFCTCSGYACGAYVVVNCVNVDVGAIYYYDTKTGELVGVYSIFNAMITCAAASPGFSQPACSPQQTVKLGSCD
jgi:hypothetical protein